jgi:hypothetical protein
MKTLPCEQLDNSALECFNQFIKLHVMKTLSCEEVDNSALKWFNQFLRGT